MGGSVADMAVGVVIATVSAIPVEALRCPHCPSALDKG